MVLKVAVWNVKGMRSNTKRVQIKDILHRFDVAMLQETHSSDIDKEAWRKELGFTTAKWASLKSNAAGAAALSRHADRGVAERNGRIAVIETKFNTKPLLIVSVYAPNMDKGTKSLDNYFEFLDKLEKVVNMYHNKNKSLIIAGDLNIVMNKDLDTFGQPLQHSSIFPKCIERWEKLKHSFALSDSFRHVYPDKLQASFQPFAKNDLDSSRRLDYALISEDIIDEVMHVEYIETGISDHKLMSLTLGEEKRQEGKGLWKHNDLMLEDEEYVNLIKDIISNTVGDTDVNRWEIIKRKVGLFCRRWGKAKAAQKRQRKEEINEDILKLERNGTDNEKLRLLKEEMAIISKEEAKAVIFRAQCEFTENDEKCTRFFYRRIARNFKQSNITALTKEDGTRIQDVVEIQNELHQFYSNLYSSKHNDSKDAELTDLPTIKPQDAFRCERTITLNEITSAIMSMKTGKSPGNDGLSVGFYRKLWKELGPIILNVLREVLEKGRMSRSQRQSCIRLIEKKDKDPSLIKNWRPISLINVDTKILSKCAAKRLAATLPQVIHTDQKAFLPGRQIHDNIVNLRLVVENAVKKKEKLGLLAIDFAKAFDSIEHGAIWKALNNAGYGPKFINMAKTLYNDAESCVMNGNRQSQWFQVSRSCRQGDCISPYLFILVIEELLIELRAKLVGYRIHDQIFTLASFADDVTLVIREEAELKNVIDILNKFWKRTGLAVNEKKCELLTVGQWNIPSGCPFPITKQLKITGVIIGNKGNATEDAITNCSIAKEKVEAFINSQKERNISLYGKSTLINSNVYGILNHSMTQFTTPTTLCTELNRRIFKWLWGGPDRVKREQVGKAWSSGGLNIQTIERRNSWSLLSWLKRYQGQDEVWAKTLAHDYKLIGGIGALSRKKVRSQDMTCITQFSRSVFLAYIANADYDQREEAVFGNSDLIPENWKKFALGHSGYRRVGEFYDADGRLVPPDKVEGIGLKEKMEWSKIYMAIRKRYGNQIIPGCTRQPFTELEHIGITVKGIQIERYDIAGKKIKQANNTDKLFSAKYLSLCHILGNQPSSSVHCYPFALTKEARKRAFCFRLLNKAIYTNKDYKRFGHKTTSKCTWCHEDEQTFEHTYFECAEVEKVFGTFWKKRETLKQAAARWYGGDTLRGESIALLEIWWYIYCRNHRHEEIHCKELENALGKVQDIEEAIATKALKLLKHESKWEKIKQSVRLN